ncbi:agmatinase [Dasania sp. GY-MA-18]|uniref:agmatinase n=1 Tax=Dasania sp. GY-MA-18 TaxID=2966584 RepID=UPI0021AC8EE6|nr:agmatinase [Dasania sp. GY-MA-18]MCR8924349.1 agmatinase [Dasania sp. GY-MA-18]
MTKPTNDLAFTREDLYGTTPEHTFAGATSFMRRKYTRDLTGVDVAVSGVPYDLATSNRSGSRMGPRAIRNISSTLSWGTVMGWNFDPFDKLAVIDYGDCDFYPGRPHLVPDEIHAHAKHILDNDVAMLTLGGDHFVTYPVVKAHAEKHGPISLIHFDAHSDTWEDEDGRIDHGTMFYHAAKQGIINPEASAQIGMRLANPKTHGYNVFDAKWVHDNGVEATAAKIKEMVGDNPCYLTFDIDCLDPCYAPGTGTPVCGGLSTYQALHILRGLDGINIVGMDLVEVAPAYDVGEITSLAGATIALDLLCLYASSKEQRQK